MGQFRWHLFYILSPGELDASLWGANKKQLVAKNPHVANNKYFLLEYIKKNPQHVDDMHLTDAHV